MRPLYLDYQRSGRPVPRLGLLLFVAALAVLAWLGQHHQTLAAQADEWERQRAQIERQARLGTPAIHPLTAQATRAQRQEVMQANQVLRQLTLPWQALFNAVEAPDGKSVALLTLAPDLQEGTVKIVGEARNFEAVLAYVRHLAARNMFDEVLLQSHQVRQDDPHKPVRFALLARWKKEAP